MISLSSTEAPRLEAAAFVLLLPSARNVEPYKLYSKYDERATSLCDPQILMEDLRGAFFFRAFSYLFEVQWLLYMPPALTN